MNRKATVIAAIIILLVVTTGPSAQTTRETDSSASNGPSVQTTRERGDSTSNRPPVKTMPLYDAIRGTSLFSDVKAWRVGDVITIIIRESSMASSKSTTETGLESSTKGGAGEGILDLVPMWGLDYESEYAGDGKTQRSGQLIAQMSARIVDVLPNGHYRIEGKRDVRINGEFEKMTLTGVVRGHDITPDNSVLSTQIAEAAISYDGNGTVGHAGEPGLFTKIVNWLF